MANMSYIFAGHQSEESLAMEPSSVLNPSTHHKSRWLSKTTLWVQLALLVLNVTFFTWNQKLGSMPCRPHTMPDFTVPANQEFSPATASIKYHVIDYKPGSPGSSNYTGEWRPEMDESWSELLQSSTIRLSADELIQMNKTSVALRDGSGYIGYLETFHLLHCVKRITQFINREHYHDLEGPSAGGYSLGHSHLDHCLEGLREGIMCHAEAKVNTWQWMSPEATDNYMYQNTGKQLNGQRGGARQCADWNAFSEWASDRAVQYNDMQDFHTMLVPHAQPGSTGP